MAFDVRNPGIWLETDRLALRAFTPADADWLAGLYADADITRYLGGLKSRAQVEELMRTRILDYYDAHPGLGMWVTLERASGLRAGFHLLNHVHGEPDIQLGFVLDKPAWGKGYGTEMAIAVVRYGFVDLALARIVGIANLPNVASHRVLEKAGLRRRGERTLSHAAYADQGPLAWFERDRDDWLAERRPPPTGSS